jgi:ABC-type Fe3+-siderophore transport system, permease component
MHQRISLSEPGRRKLNRAARAFSVYVILVALLCAAFITSLFMGRYSIDPFTVVVILASKSLDVVIWASGVPSSAFAPYAHSFSPVTEGIAATLDGLATLLRPAKHTWPLAMDTVIWQLRFPRSIAVILVGAGLAISGASFQGTFRNPLVSENILGVSAGAGVGACIGILIGQGPFVIQLLAFGFGLLAVSMTYLISRVYHSNPKLVLVLAGIIVGGLFSAISSILKYVADPYTKLPDMVFWVMGSFAKVSVDGLLVAMPVILVPMGLILLVRWRLNVLSMGDEDARSMGLDTKKFRTVVILCATLITAGAVSVSGVIVWVGLIIPHIGRMIVGPDHKSLLPVSVLIGASFMLVVDTICRNLTSVEVPVSIVTSILGAPLFMYLLYKTKDNW